MSSYWIPILTLFAASSLVQLFIVGGLTLGYAKINLAIVDRDDIRFRDLFSQMRLRRNLEGLKLVVFRGFLVFFGEIIGLIAGALVAIVLCVGLNAVNPFFDRSMIPGILAFFSMASMMGFGFYVRLTYAFAPYVMCDDPQYSPVDALEESKQLLDGRKGELFGICFGFLGWFALGIVTLGIASLWVKTYYEATVADYYRQVSVASHRSASRVKEPGGGCSTQTKEPPREFLGATLET